MKYTYSVVILMVVLISCKRNESASTPNYSEDKGVKVEVIKSAGDLFDHNDEYLGLPTNLAKVGNAISFVIGKPLKKDQNLNVYPIGAIRILQNDTLKTILVSIPSDQEFQTIAPKSFDEFATIHSSIKWILEQYLINRNLNQRTTLKSWEDDKFAINFILK